MSCGAWRTGPPVLVPDSSVWWLTSHTGATAARVHDDRRLELLVSGRDHDNRSHIGRAWLHLDDLGAPAQVEPDPVLSPGGRGAFDDSGVSYPCVVDAGGRSYLFFTGWSRSCTTGFQNDLGLAVLDGGTYRRVSRAPILPRNDADHLGVGSAFALVDDAGWHLWYTAFTGWADADDPAPHRYLIKYASSRDGVAWDRDDVMCVGPASADEHSICRPSVVRRGTDWHMWFCSRGDHYRIGHAVSRDGVEWRRSPAPVSFSSSIEGFDDIERAYPHVVQDGDRMVMVYSGNGYGRAGLGLAVLGGRGSGGS